MRDPELTGVDELVQAKLPDVESVRAFVAVALTGNWRGAAADLETSPQSVRRAVQRLERHVGERLLHRDRSGARLTGPGRAAFVAAQRALTVLARAFGGSW